ncbi:MAG: flagellar filament capping protein FliD [Betaproteobacteria bacterium]|nr:flagellar filament capping protein FliD [Betaproteobacteria bacterium]
MAISAPGIGSNLDVNGIVSQLMTVERAPLDRLDIQEASYQAKLSAYGSVRSALSSFRNAIDSLASGSGFRTRTASSSDSAVATASASSLATSGSYAIDVSKVAQAQALAAAGQASTTATIGTGASTEITFEFGAISGGTLTAGSYSGATFTPNAEALTGSVTIDSTNNSLAGIKDAINAANIGVRASIVNDGGTSPYRLVLQSTSTGAKSSLKISVSGDSEVSNLLSYDPAGTQNLTQTVEAQDAALTVNGLSIQSASNNVTEAIQGVNLSLLTAGTSTISVSRDTSAGEQAVQGFVKAYNDLNTTLNGLSTADPTAGTAAPLNGDSSVRSIQNQLRSAIGGSLGSGYALKTLSDVGIAFQRDGTLLLDSTKLSSAIDNNPDAVAALFASSGNASDSLVNVVGQTSATQPGVYSLSVGTLATRGTLTGSAAANLTITSSVNDSLSVALDGVTATVKLTAGTYTASTLAAMLQSAINGSSTLSSAGLGVAVSENAGILTLTSNQYGSASSVGLGGTAAAGLLGASPVATDGVDIAGSIGGIEAFGSGQVLNGASKSVTEGLRVEVTGGNTGSRGEITVGNGFAARLSTLVDQFIGSDGTIASRTNGINRSIQDLGRQRDTLTQRLSDTEQRYRDQFASLDVLISNMRQTSNFLTQQLGALSSVG